MQSAELEARTGSARPPECPSNSTASAAPGSVVRTSPSIVRVGENHELIASVAYALWEQRRTRNDPDDPEADWFNAQELLDDLESHQPLSPKQENLLERR